MKVSYDLVEKTKSSAQQYLKMSYSSKSFPYICRDCSNCAVYQMDRNIILWGLKGFETLIHSMSCISNSFLFSVLLEESFLIAKAPFFIPIFFFNGNAAKIVHQCRRWFIMKWAECKEICSKIDTYSQDGDFLPTLCSHQLPILENFQSGDILGWDFKSCSFARVSPCKIN